MTVLLRGKKTPTQRAISYLRSLGQDAHIYLPGVGMLNGLQAGNFIDSALTTPAAIDNPVGGVVDAMGGINATQPTTSAKPILRRGAVNLLTYSGDFSNAAWVLGGVATKSGAVLNTPNVGDAAYNSTTVAAGTYTLAIELSGSGTCSLWGYNTTEFAIGNRQIVLGDRALFVTTFTTVNAANTLRFGRRTGDTTTAITFHAAAIFQGTYTAQQIQALGGIPTTLTAPVSTALGAYWWDTSGSKSLVATFPAGNESVTVINATPTGQVTTTAQNVVGAYNINTDTNGRIIVNGVLTASELALLQRFANRLAGL